MGDSTARVIRMSEERFDDVVETLCDAFQDYPVMRYILKDAGDAYDSHLPVLVGYFTGSRFSRNWPVLGAIDEGKLVGAANINPPHLTPAPPALEERYRRMCDQLGEGAIERFHRFADACAKLEPDDLHYGLGMIGVRRQCHGRGHARLLLDAVHEMSANDPDSKGVLLTTETPGNLELYKHFGYLVLGEARADDLRSWTLWRPD